MLKSALLSFDKCHIIRPWELLRSSGEFREMEYGLIAVVVALGFVARAKWDPVLPLQSSRANRYHLRPAFLVCKKYTRFRGPPAFVNSQYLKNTPIASGILYGHYTSRVFTVHARD